MEFEDILGVIYVTAWSISMYPPLYISWKRKSARAISPDFVLLNLTGYFYLVCSLTLQMYKWIPHLQSNIERPKLTGFDYCYCLHGFILTVLIASQLFMSRSVWRFPDTHQFRMKPVYKKVLLLSIFLFGVLTLQFTYHNMQSGWDNERTLAYCNNLFLLKISMSLIKYIPQVLHNFERKSMQGFAISGVFLDMTGGIASIVQLIFQILKESEINLSILISNFGKIGLAMVTLIFNTIFISQWLLYEKKV